MNFLLNSFIYHFLINKKGVEKFETKLKISKLFASYKTNKQKIDCKIFADNLKS